MGLIPISVSLHYNLSPFGFPIFSRFNIIECRSWEEEKTKNCPEWLNYESYCLFPSRMNSRHFYDPISVLMDEVCKNHTQPWRDFIPYYPYLSHILTQQVKMASISFHITSKLSLTCCIINCKERSNDPFGN